MNKQVRKLFSISLTSTMLFAMVGITSVVSAQTLTAPQSEVTVTGRVTRTAGQDRYVTAATLATSAGSSNNNAVLVSGGNYADAISATTLAKHLNAPILLTDQGGQKLNVNTKIALATLKTKTIYVIGGTGVITLAVREELHSMGYALVELGGLTRYATNIKVANELVALGVKTTNVMMVGGENFPDALSVAPIAANKDEILLLANTNVTSSKATIDFANNWKSNVTIVGTTNMVSNAVKSALDVTTPRINGGLTRYDTNKIILDTFNMDIKFNKVYIATGEDFPDALVASPLAGNAGGALLLVNTKVGDSTYKASINFY